MSNDLDEFVQNLQKEIFDETKKDFGDVAYDRWRNPLYNGSMDDPDGYGRLTGTCGDTMQIFLKFENDKIKHALFQTDGCGSSAVCGSFAAELALGKNPDELLAVTGETILKKLEGFPEAEEHCAYLAGETLQEALNDYMLKQIQNEKSKNS